MNTEWMDIVAEDLIGRRFIGRCESRVLVDYSDATQEMKLVNPNEINQNMMIMYYFGNKIMETTTENYRKQAVQDVLILNRLPSSNHL